jgi:hypothetical protein
MADTMTYEHLIDECKRLRGRHQRAEAEFFVFLMSAEREHAAVWRDAGCVTFEQFLKSNHLCDPSRYRFFAIGVDRVGVGEALANGAFWTIERGRMDQATPPIAIQEFTARAHAFVETEGFAPSEQAVREWRSQVVASGKDHATVRKVNALARLREENKRLSAELKVAKTRITELEGQLLKRKRKAA